MNPVVTTNDCHDLDAVRSGDLEAFGRIHDRHAPLVLSICRRRGFGGPNGSLADAEDATQEVFIRAYRKLDTVEDCTRLRSWLCAIAGYVLRERRRAAARRHHHEGVAVSASIQNHGGVSSVTPEQELTRRERFAALESALDGLADEGTSRHSPSLSRTRSGGGRKGNAGALPKRILQTARPRPESTRRTTPRSRAGGLPMNHRLFNISMHRSPDAPGSGGPDDLDRLLRDWHDDNIASARDGRDRLIESVAADDAPVGRVDAGTPRPKPDTETNRRRPVRRPIGGASLFSGSGLAAAALFVIVGVLAVLVLEPSPNAAFAQVVQVPEGGRLDAFAPDGEAIGPCPLQGTDVEADISGPHDPGLAHSDLRQSVRHAHRSGLYLSDVAPRRGGSHGDDRDRSGWR